MTLGWWLLIALGLGVVEVVTVDLIFVNLALAALVAGGFAYFGFALPVQLVAYGVAALLLLLLVRPWAKSFLSRNTLNIQTNALRLVGQPAIVIEPVDANGGRVRLDGEVWSARTSDGLLPTGAQATVISIDGATAVVALVDKE